MKTGIKTKYIDEHIVCYDSYSLKSKPELKKFFKKKKLEKFLEKIPEEVILVLGGDGTMLRAVRENYEKGLPFLGINFGSKGFLLNDKAYLKKKNKYTPRKYPLLEIRQNGEFIGTALNDVNIYSPEGKTVDIDIALSPIQEGSKKIQTKLRGDGVLISTPAGSTAHNKSGGGAILPHTSSHLIITPKLSMTPHTPKVIEGDRNIFIENSGRKNNIGVNIDGEPMHLGKNVLLEIKKSQKNIELLILQNYLEEWDNKVLWEQGFNS